MKKNTICTALVCDASDVNYCDEDTETSESLTDALPKKTNFYALRKVKSLFVILSYDRQSTYISRTDTWFADWLI